MGDDRTLPFDFAPPPPPRDEGPRTLTVGELARAVRSMLEEAFEYSVYVEGEVTGCRPAASGHVYFTLKDEREEATLDAVVYRTNLTARARGLLKDGARVRLRGRPSFWVPRGRIQLVADRVEAAGKGALLEALERLKEKLAAEGLFAAARKRRLPAEPRIIGVVSSAGGAVIHDICTVAFRRGGAHILLAAAQVQGQGAADSMRRALHALCRVKGVDAIVLARGGGSADDLSAFNDEALVRAVAACAVPIVSAVGHEVDVTLTDFAADVRAATPSQAAELLVPDRRARARVLEQARGRLVHAMRARLTEQRVRLGRVERKMGDPRLVIASQQQRLDELTMRLQARHPRLVLERHEASLARGSDRMTAAMRARLASRRASLGTLAAHLNALSPLSVLGRGYAIATRADGRAVRTAQDVAPGARITVRVASARIEADVVGVARDERDANEVEP